jgi:hypothetical protein
MRFASRDIQNSFTEPSRLGATAMKKKNPPSDDVSSAPESGTGVDETSGNKPSDRGVNPAHKQAPASGDKRSADEQPNDDPSIAGEEA